MGKYKTKCKWSRK